MTDWAPEHCDALRAGLAAGLSFSQVAKAINAKFKTAYSRSAALGRARRMGVVGPGRSKPAPGSSPKPAPTIDAARVCRSSERQDRGLLWPMPVFEPAGLVELRCVEIVPRHLSLLDLEPGDCRYPYGGEQDAAVSFCGHPSAAGRSYCAPHLRLTRGPGALSVRVSISVHSQVLEAA
jgi:GcrA cell cycle regulator